MFQLFCGESAAGLFRAIWAVDRLQICTLGLMAGSLHVVISDDEKKPSIEGVPWSLGGISGLGEE